MREPVATYQSQPLRVFLTHGRETQSYEELRDWVKRRKALSINLIDFETSFIFGDSIYGTIERVASDCDAALILATPDDFGRLAADSSEQPRARQNVWMELGWFWARLGRNRTFLLIKGNVDIPSNYQGVIYGKYQNSLSEIEVHLKKFFGSLRSLEPDNLTEIVYLSSDSASREGQWQEIQNASHHKLIIMGIAMGSIRNALPSTFATMKERHALKLDFIVIHPEYAKEHSEFLDAHHRRNAVTDNRSFFGEALAQMKQCVEISNRIRFLLYRGIPTFAAVTADGPSWGSVMIVQPFVPKPINHLFNHPRFKLKRRTNEGVYMTYWKSIEELANRCTDEIKGIGQLEQFVVKIQKLNPL